MEEAHALMTNEFKYMIEDMGLTMYFPGKITETIAESLIKEDISDAKDIPGNFFESVFHPCYDNRPVFVPFNNDLSESLEDLSCDIDYSDTIEDKEEQWDVEIYSHLDVTVAVLLCSTYQCREMIAKSFAQSQLSIPFTLPDYINKSNLVIQTHMLKAILNEGEYEAAIPILSFLSVNGKGILKTKLINSILSENATKPFFDSEKERHKVTGKVKDIFLHGLIEAAVERSRKCCCKRNVSQCTLTRDALILNLYKGGSDSSLETQEQLLYEISTMVIMVIDCGILAGDSLVFTKINNIVRNSKQSVLVLTKEDESSLDDCKKGVEELKANLENDKVQVVILFQRTTGVRDSFDLQRNHMRRKINCFLKTLTNDVRTLKEKMENLSLENITIVRD